MKAAFLAVLMLAAPAAMGQGAVLVAPLPEGLDASRVLALTRHVLEARKWDVEPASDGISLVADNDTSTLRITVDRDAVRYVDRVRRARPGGARQRNRESNEPLAAVPQAEIDALRADLLAAFANPPAHLAGTRPPTKPAPAPSRVLYGDLPKADPARVLDKARLALVARGWKLVPAEEDVIVAQNTSGETDVSIRIFVADGALRYHDRSTRRGGGKGEVPERWLANLRRDLSKSLPELAASASRAEPSRAQPERAKADVAERLRRLQSLLDAGVITPDEYTKRRTEILKEL